MVTVLVNLDLWLKHELEILLLLTITTTITIVIIIKAFSFDENFERKKPWGYKRPGKPYECPTCSAVGRSVVPQQKLYDQLVVA